MVTIKLDEKKGNYEDGPQLIVVTGEQYQHCEFFNIYTHSSNDSLNLTISSFFWLNKNITIDYGEETIDAQSVSVYFYKWSERIPLVLRVVTGVKTSYYVNVIQAGNNYSLDSRNEIDPRALFEKLIHENLKMNRILTYMLDKGEGIYNRNAIRVTYNKNSNGINTRVHKPAMPGNRGSFSNTLFNGKPFKILNISNGEGSFDVQHKRFERISLYSLETDPNCILLIEFLECDTDKRHYFSRNLRDESQWKYEEKYGQIKNGNLSTMLYEIKSRLFVSLVVLIDKKDSYGKNEIKIKKDEITSVQPESIGVTMSLFESYKKYSHNIIPGLTGFYDINVIILPYMFNTELRLLGNGMDPKPLHYLPSIKNLEVYYSTDQDLAPFPLMIEYNKGWFSPRSKAEYFTKWKEVSVAETPNDGTNKLKEQLHEVEKILNIIDITQRKDYGIPTSSSAIDGTPILSPTIFKVKDVMICPLSDLFRFYTHTRKSSKKFTITSLIVNGNFDDKDVGIHTLKLTNSISEVQSVDVYFSGFNSEVPLIVKIATDSKNFYYSDLFGGDYDLTEDALIEDSKINDANLLERLIYENLNKNGTITYQLDKQVDYQEKRISIDKNSSNIREHGFVIYTHRPNRIPTYYPSFVLYNDQLFDVIDNPEIDHFNQSVQNKSYESVSVYVLKDIKVPLLVEFALDPYNHPPKSHYYKPIDGKGSSWMQIKAIKGEELKMSPVYTKDVLQAIDYSLKKSIKIDIDKQGESYSINIVKNNERDESSERIAGDIIVERVGYHKDYNCLKHDIKPSGVISDQDVVGVAIFYQGKRLRFYDSAGKGQKLLYHKKEDQGNKIYAYVGKKGRNAPKVICFDGRAYIPAEGEESRWVEISDLDPFLMNPEANRGWDEKDIIDVELDKIKPKKISFAEDEPETEYGIGENFYEGKEGGQDQNDDHSNNKNKLAFIIGGITGCLLTVGLVYPLYKIWKVVRNR